MTDANAETIAIQTDDKGRIFSHVRQKWLVETPEERVRQTYLTVLVNEYGFRLEQMKEEESVVGRGSGQARADFIIWRTAQDKADDRPPLIVVECKSDSVTIKGEDYHQGDHYARMANAPFFVTHNTRETRFWRVLKVNRPGFSGVNPGRFSASGRGCCCVTSVMILRDGEADLPPRRRSCH